MGYAGATGLTSQDPMLTEDRIAAIVTAMRRAARTCILPRFRNLAEGEIGTKSGPADLVTLADTEAEAQIAADLARDWPEARVLGEEGVAADKSLRAEMATADWAVIVDPVDGTWNFAKGLSVFGMIVAVLHRGVPVWAMLYDPIMDDWIAAGTDGPAEMVTAAGRRVLRTSAEARVGRMNGYVTAGLFPKADQARIVSAFPDFARVTSLRCACHEYRMLVQGHVEFCLSGPVPHPWDHAAGVLAVQRAGGVARFLDGEAYHADRAKGVVLAASSAAVWDDLAARFAFLG
jgi:fructose-1,6-bisphosphatase/inositol monophosphatase family enzyme